MKSYGEIRRETADKLRPLEQTRTDYRCKAHGCPNAGCCLGDLCYAHWSEPDPTTWHTVTQRIRENFDALRNWGEVSPERKAAQRAAAQKRHGVWK
jgi:hypothetical protein